MTRRRMMALLAAGLVVAAAGMRGQEVKDRAPFVQWAGHETRREEAGWVMVGNEADWRELWAEHAGVDVGHGAMERYGAPIVDFGRCFVVGYFAGPRTNSDGEVVQTIQERPGELLIRFWHSSFQTLGPDGGGVRTRPFGLWVIERPEGAKPIVIEEQAPGLKSDPPAWREVKRFAAAAR